jgi:hypothetical protein
MRAWVHLVSRPPTVPPLSLIVALTSEWRPLTLLFAAPSFLSSAPSLTSNCRRRTFRVFDECSTSLSTACQAPSLSFFLSFFFFFADRLEFRRSFKSAIYLYYSTFTLPQLHRLNSTFHITLFHQLATLFKITTSSLPLHSIQIHQTLSSSLSQHTYSF